MDECKPLTLGHPALGKTVLRAMAGRSSHSSTFQLNLSAIRGTRGVYELFGGYVCRGWRGCLGV